MLLNIALVKFSELILFFDNIFYTLSCCECTFVFLKPGSDLPKKIICFNDSPPKWWKMLFISSWKLFSFSRYLSFCLDYWPCRKNDSIRKITLISKFMTSQPDCQRITTHILLNISRIKANQTMKFGQLIQHPKRNIFL